MKNIISKIWRLIKNMAQGVMLGQKTKLWEKVWEINFDNTDDNGMDENGNISIPGIKSTDFLMIGVSNGYDIILNKEKAFTQYGIVHNNGLIPYLLMTEPNGVGDLVLVDIFITVEDNNVRLHKPQLIGEVNSNPNGSTAKLEVTADSTIISPVVIYRLNN